MANHCENVLHVTGDHADLLRFDRAFRANKEDLDENYHFDNLYPTPKLPICDMADWRKKHWGVKGNFYEDSFEHDCIMNGVMETCYYFETPWVAPALLVEAVSKKFPALTFLLVFREDGNRLGGMKAYSDGALISDEELNDADRAYWF